MKLPITNLNKLKLLSLKPFKKVASKSSSTSQTGPGRTHKLVHTKREKTKQEKTKREKTKQEKSAYQIALTLLLIRPWVLVLGLWIFSMGIGTLALGSMLSPRQLTKALPDSTFNASVDSSNQPRDTLVTGTRTEVASDETDEAAVEKTDLDSRDAITNGDAINSSQLPLALPLVLIVSSCVIGCFVISRQRAMKMASAKARVRKAHSGLKVSTATNRQPSSRKASVSKAAVRRPDSRADVSAASVRPVRKASARTLPKTRPTTTQPTTTTKTTTTQTTVKTGSRISLPKVEKPMVRNLAAELRPRRRSRFKNRLDTRRTAVEANRNGRKVLVSRTTATRSNARPHPPRPRLRKRTLRAASRRRHPVVNVVPANESHALDWQEGSLAHEMDVRSRRSAM